MNASRRRMAYTAAAMYGGAVIVNLVEGAIPGGPEISLLLGFAALVAVAVLLPAGPLLYVWPVLWVTYCFGAAGRCSSSPGSPLCRERRCSRWTKRAGRDRALVH